MFGMSRENIRFLQPFYFFGALFSVVPYYSFENYSIPYPRFFKVYAAVLACPSLSFRIFLIYTGLRKSEFNIMMVVDVILDLLLAMILLLAQSISWRPNEWTILNKSFQEIDDDLKKTKLKDTLVQNASYQFLAWNVVYLSFLAYTADRKDIGPAVSHRLVEYSYFLINIIIGNLAAAFKCRYGKLNKLLEKNTKTLDGIRHGRRIYSRLNKNLLIFNSIFGWSLTLILALNTLAILSSFYLVAKRINFKNAEVTEEFFINLIATALLAFVTVTLVMTCDSLKEERDTTICLLIECQEKFAFGSQEVSELQAWIQENKLVRLSAAKFFEIDRRILLRMLSITATYFVVLMQFS